MNTYQHLDAVGGDRWSFDGTGVEIFLLWKNKSSIYLHTRLMVIAEYCRLSISVVGVLYRLYMYYLLSIIGSCADDDAFHTQTSPLHDRRLLFIIPSCFFLCASLYCVHHDTRLLYYYYIVVRLYVGVIR